MAMYLTLSDHAIDRMLERRVTHAEVLEAVEFGAMSAKPDNQLVFRTRKIKVYAVVVDDTLLIVTVGKREQGGHRIKRKK